MQEWTLPTNASGEAGPRRAGRRGMRCMHLQPEMSERPVRTQCNTDDVTVCMVFNGGGDDNSTNAREVIYYTPGLFTRPEKCSRACCGDGLPDSPECAISCNC
jgi:hypothetical protein